MSGFGLFPAWSTRGRSKVAVPGRSPEVDERWRGREVFDAVAGDDEVVPSDEGIFALMRRCCFCLKLSSGLPGLQLRWWIGRRSGLKVRPHTLHGSICAFAVSQAASL